MAKGVDAVTGLSPRFKDRRGERNGRLFFIRAIGINKHKHWIWEAVCDCGVVTTTSRPHATKSCGCLRSETAAQRQKLRALPPDVRKERESLNRKRQREKRKLDPVKAMQARLSRLHRHALAQVGAIKKSPTFASLGYTPAQFVQHIERQFHEGMGWHNMAMWQIDHIIPVSEARTEDDVLAFNQLSNLRPMWARENNKKKNKRLTLL